MNICKGFSQTKENLIQCLLRHFQSEIKLQKAEPPKCPALRTRDGVCFEQFQHFIYPSFLCTFSLSRSVAVFQSLSDRILVTLGNRMDTPAAVWVVELVNSAPVISHTGAA